MRSSIVAAAAFAAGAVAVPHHMHKPRAIVTDWDVVYVTNIVTVTEGAEPAAAATTIAKNQNWNHHWHWTSQKAAEPTTTTSVYVAPTSSSSEWVAPDPTSYIPPPPTTPAWTAPASTQAPATSSAAPAPTSGSDPTDYQGSVVYHHNVHRSNHSAPALEWDSGLASTAQKIAASCNYAHNVDMDGGGYGQNIAAGPTKEAISEVISDLFYNGEMGYFADQYNKASPDMGEFEKWGHFSQIVWKGTTHVGCYTQDCSSGGLGSVGSNVPPYFTVCNYKSPGNYGGEYAKNIGKPLGHATVAGTAKSY